MRGIGEVLFPDFLMAGLTDIGIGVLGASRLQEPARSLRRGWISGPPRQATTNHKSPKEAETAAVPEIHPDSCIEVAQDDQAN